MKYRKLKTVLLVLCCLVFIGAKWKAATYQDDSAFTVDQGWVTPMGALVDDTTPDSATEGDVGIPRMSANRILYTQQGGHADKTLAFARIDTDLSGGTEAELVAATAAQKIYVVEMFVTVSAQCHLEIAEGGSATAAAPPMLFPAYGGVHLERLRDGYYFVTDAVNEGLDIDEVGGVSVNLRGYLWYYKE